jgi:hypothetical protein
MVGTADQSSTTRLTGLARHLFDQSIRLNRAWAKLQEAMREEMAGGVSPEDAMRAIDRGADTEERRQAQAQLERVISPKRAETDTERKAREIVEGKRPVKFR